ncbi:MULTISPECIES: AccI family restriction endonuclease [unclassified Microcystis]|uniref:AccI family restriction endonuclease n=1 Tax=unclassified Microcystis TaxID=2643300 RepID=UPI002588BBB0|nr:MULTISPECIES: AccI family restriction endonuclease [unclassified Microcystis]
MSVNIVNFSEARKNFKSVKINGQIGKEVLGKIDMPEHKSALKELDRGRLLFYVTFAGGKGYLDNKIFLRDVINA